MSQRSKTDPATGVRYDLERSISLVDPDVQPEGIEVVRSAVSMTREAARAISITALETLREGARFMGVLGSRGELLNPFGHIDAAIWSETDVPEYMVDTAYDYCEELTRVEAGNFYHSFKYLPNEARRAICAYYAFCRRADDIADGDYVDLFPGGSSDDPEAIEYRADIERLTGSSPVVARDHYDDRMSQLFYYRKKLSTAYGQITSTDPIFIALKDTIRRYNIPRQLLDDMISGMEDDFHQNRYETFEELYSYCYRVASTVGLVCIEIYGYDDLAAREFSESWGIFMQLTNIIRDVAEDAERDRIYLPMEDLRRYGISEQDVKSGADLLEHPGWKPFVDEYISRAETYRDKAFKLLPLLDRQSRYSPAAMMAFYESILKKIDKSEGDVFTQRVQLSKAEKITLAAYVYTRYRFLAL
ncbi:MAG: phytoene/squalene synthase family protein [Candidatus Thalassarchaeaceae archaeon]|nr:phytoene/squalene synthase family protein [Candidatus Thalassarchaeaceae archaeon]